MHISLTILSPLGTRRAAYRRALFMQYRIFHPLPAHFRIDFGGVTQSEHMVGHSSVLRRRNIESLFKY